MPRTTPAVLAWFGLAAHLVVGMAALVTRRHPGPEAGALPRPLPWLNLAVALGVLAYWARAWYGSLARGVTWYASDQAVPLYAALVALASGLALAGWFAGAGARAVHWTVFGVDAVVFAAAVVYLTFARFDRLF